MENKAEWREYAGKIGQAAAGFLCSGISVLGYYPFLTGFFAATCLWKRQSFFLYVGIVAGFSYFMNYQSMLKYMLLLLAIWTSVKVYRYANRQCGGIAAGVIAGVCTMAMDFSGTLLAWQNRETLVLGASEAVLTAGLACGFHYLMELCRSLHLAAFEAQEDKRIDPVWQDGRMEALAGAVSGLADAVLAHSRREASADAAHASMDASHPLRAKMMHTATFASGVTKTERNDSSEKNAQDVRDATALYGDAGSVAVEGCLAGAGSAPVGSCLSGMEAMSDSLLGTGGKMLEGCLAGAGSVALGDDLGQDGEEASRAWHRRLQENRAAVVQQLSAMVDLLKNWSRKEKVLDDQLKLLTARILFETREKGLLVEDLHILEDAGGRRMVRARVASKWAGGIPSRNYAKALARAMHGPMRLARDTQSVISREWVDITAYEDTVYYTLPGIAMHKRDDSVMTGDNFTMFDLDSGMHYIGLSDGMGSGFMANQESELVVDLLERLVRAGFDEDTTISLMNSAFVLQGEDCSFSTLDLAKVDLYSGNVEIRKVGAAASFLKRKDEVEELSDAALPAGALLEETPAMLRQQVESGDFLVMVTDGVLECFQTEDASEHFAHMIAGVRTDNAGVLARTLLEKTLRVAGGRARDDMTVLVTGIWEKKQ